MESSLRPRIWRKHFGFCWRTHFKSKKISHPSLAFGAKSLGPEGGQPRLRTSRSLGGKGGEAPAHPKCAAVFLSYFCKKNVPGLFVFGFLAFLVTYYRPRAGRVSQLCSSIEIFWCLWGGPVISREHCAEKLRAEANSPQIWWWKKIGHWIFFLAGLQFFL